MIRLPFTVPLALFLATVLSAQSSWSTPVNETALNTTASDSGPHLSFDGLTIHFSSYRSGNWEIHSATRPFVGGSWSAPVLESVVSDPAATDDQPFLSADGLQLWLGSGRSGGAGSTDILMATRPNVAAPWNVPNWVTQLNSASADSSPSLTADGLEVYFLTTGWGAPYAPQNAIFRATRTTTSVPFGTPALVTELSTPNTHRDAEISPDGLSIVYTEYYSSAMHVLFAERTNRTAQFGTPVEWTEFGGIGSRGIYSFTRSVAGNEAFMAALFPSASGAQEILRSRFDGLTHVGIASSSGTMTLFYRDSAAPGMGYMMGAALGNTGFTLGSRHVPLDPDWLLGGTLAISVPPWSSGFAGVLDGSGEAQALLTNTGGFLNGFSVWVGAFTIDPSQPFAVGRISNAVQVEFQ